MMFKKRIMPLLLTAALTVPGGLMAGAVQAASPGGAGSGLASAAAVQAAAAPVNIAYRKQAFASLYQNVPGMGSTAANTAWSTGDLVTSLPSYDETAMLVTDGMIGDVANPLPNPTLEAMNINGTATASGAVSAVTSSNLGQMINGQTMSSGTATIAYSAAAPPSDSNPLIIKATLPKPEKVVAYSMLQQLGSSAMTSKPYAWKLQASKTGGSDLSEWTDIDAYTATTALGAGALTNQTAAAPFNGMDTRYLDATPFAGYFYTYNGSAQATAGMRRATTCGDYYKYYRLFITRINSTATTGNVNCLLADLALFAEGPSGNATRNVLRNPFISRWTSTANANQWIYVDLGQNVSYNDIKLYWGSDSYPTAYTVDVSNDVSYNYGNGDGTAAHPNTWTTVRTVSKSAGGTDDVTFPAQTARYVRINMTDRVAGSANYKLYEYEVYGTSGAAPYANPARPAPAADGTQQLTGGDWTIARAEDMTATGEELSAAGYDDSAWLPAKVPGTALMSYVKAGVLPDPNFDMNMMQISDTYFYSDWWYRTSFDIPAGKAGQKTYVNFDGINWKAKVFVNGHALSGDPADIEGAFIRGRLDITPYANFGGKNYMAVHVIPPEHYSTAHTKSYSTPNTNGGLLGADNPTFHAAANWDWIPTIRGRDTGIYDNVYVSYSGGVNLVDPWVVTNFDKLRDFSDNDLNSDITPSDDPAYDFSVAHTTLKTEVKNTGGADITATVSGTYNPGNIAFSKDVLVPAGQTVPVEIPVDIHNPQIWWPNGYGAQPLYTADVKVSAGGAASDTNTFRFGVRKLVYTYTGTVLPTGFSSNFQSDTAVNVYCNGVRIWLRGGNWGMDDSNVDLTPEDYRVRIKLHAEENFNMIRNWVGQTGKEAFYDACDEYGILVWDDFWLANPWDGPDPLNNDMFLKNAADKIRVVRKHPSEAIYNARNESVVARPLDSGLQDAIMNLDGTRIYNRSSDSAVFGINGHGPYTEQERKAYFAGSNSANFQLHTERGQHVIPNPEVLTKYFRPENMWPGFTSDSAIAHPWRVSAVAANVWGVHDFFFGGNGPANNFFTQLNSYATMAQLNASYNDINDFTRVSQLPNYDLHRAMFEGFVEKKGSGLLMWMSMSCWPSFAWRTFDYYYDTSAAYFGIKKACEPLTIIWNPTNGAANTNTANSSTYNPRPGEIVVANNTGKVLTNIRAVGNIYDMNGKLIKNAVNMSIPKLSVDQVLPVSTAANSDLWPADSTKVMFLKLQVLDENGRVAADNFYWHDAADTGASSAPDYTQMQNIPDVNVTSAYVAAGSDAASKRYNVYVRNPSDSVAIQVRVKAADPANGDMILPVYYSDNYFDLLPGESKIVNVEIENQYFGGQPQFSVSGFNVNAADVSAGNGIAGSMRFMMNGAPITQIASGDVSLEATITAYGDADTAVWPIIALYKNGVLVGINTASQHVTLKAGDTITLNTPAVKIPAGDLTAYQVKGFIWDGKMGPIADAASLAPYAPAIPVPES